MRIEDFSLHKTRFNFKERIYLDISELPDGSIVRLPVLIAHGKGEGRVLLALGGVHGDEYEGPQAIREVFDNLDTAEMMGKFIGIPVANPPAHCASRRESPIDRLDLARLFPGRNDGTISERIAYHIGRMISMSNFLIDLHSAGLKYDAPTLCGYVAVEGEAGRVSKEAANIFGAPVVWEHPSVSPGRTLSVAIEKGIPCLYTETRGGAWLSNDSVLYYKNGLLNVMKYLGMIPGPYVCTSKVKYFMFGGGDVDKDSIKSSASGFLISFVDILNEVKEGEVLGKILNPLGETVQEVISPSNGYVIFKRSNPIVCSGEWIYLLAHCLQPI
jgi:predicted deacylase